MQTKEYVTKTLYRVLFFLCFPLLAGCAAKDEWTLAADVSSREMTAQVQAVSGADDTTAPEAETQTDTHPEAAPSAKQISVHVCGAVNRAGVYSVPEDARVIDAVNAAGGFGKDADSEAVNLAAFLVDGCRLRIPSLSETREAGEDAQMPVMTVGTDDISADSLVVLADGISEKDGKINLNTATEEELCTLNGIGKKRASDIIRYREEHGAFANIEDIMKVNGIKQSLFAKIREYIKV